MDKIVDKRLVILSAITFCFLISIFLINSNVSYAMPNTVPTITSIDTSGNSIVVHWAGSTASSSVEVYNSTTGKMKKISGSETSGELSKLSGVNVYNFMIRACYNYTNCTKWSDVKSSSYTNDDFKVTLSAKSYTYDGKEKKPTVTVKNKEGITLTPSQDYTIVYPKDLKNAGAKTITVRGLGNYAFEQKPTYTINKVTTVQTTSLNQTTFVYNGKEKKPTVTVTTGKNKTGTKLVKDTDYTVSYKNYINIGTGTVTITGKGNYSFTKSETYKILPADTKITSTSKTKNSITVKMAKRDGNVKYQVLYKKTSASSYKVKNTTSTSYKITGLAANTKYTIKVRTYKKVNNKVYYSKNYSALKHVTTNK